MNEKWMICDHHLAVEAGAKAYHLNATEVYSCFDTVRGEKNKIGLSCGDPRLAFPSIRFSKTGSPVKAELVTDEEGKICFSIYAIRKKNRFPVDVINGQIVDQCVLEKEWFYLSGNTLLLEEAMNSAEIKSCGRISMSQYLALLKYTNKESTSIIDNHITASLAEKEIEPEEQPDLLKGVCLYPYQIIGFSWMQFMLSENRGCILGDEMGLGKTLQVIALIAEYKRRGRLPILVIAPVSLLENWRRECGKFAPSIDAYIHHGSDRTGFYHELQKHDVVIISYNTASSDSSMLKMIKWHFVVVDEAQNIKNPYSERARAIKSIPRAGSIAVTGTPFENHIQDIWSLVDYIIPGYLGTLEEYKKAIPDDVYGAEMIEPLLSPIMIRRRVFEVASDLPEKVVIPQAIVMSENEARDYERYREEACGQAEQSVGLGVLQKLRMYCTHPSLCKSADLTNPDLSCDSVKYQRFCEIIEEIVTKGEKVIVFTSYKKMFEAMEQDITCRFKIPFASINGETPVAQRQEIVDRFNVLKGSALLALNPRAAGTGLNITGANHVIHYNLEWNPALEDQASARAYRRGQQKTVFVYRLFYSNTVEEIINQRIEKKRLMADAAVVGNTGESTGTDDILAALALSPIVQSK